MEAKTVYLSIDDIHTLRTIFGKDILDVYKYITPEEYITGEIGLLNVRLIAKQ